MQMLGIYYKLKDLRIGVGAFNPFTNNYKIQNENWNRFASYKTQSYIKESAQLFLVNLSYNFSFGRKFKVMQRKVSNSDNDSGVIPRSHCNCQLSIALRSPHPRYAPSGL